MNQKYKENSNLNYYCIHHIKDLGRKSHMDRIFNLHNINPIWVTEFLPESNEVKKFPKTFSKHSANNNYLNNAEKSLYLKQLLAFEKIMNSNKIGLIIEDDLEMPNFEFKNFCELIFDKFNKSDGHFVFIGGSHADQRTDTNNELIFSEPNLYSRCCHCYMVKPETSKLIFDFLMKPLAPFDWQLNYAIQNFNLKVFHSFKIVEQRTQNGSAKSLLR